MEDREPYPHLSDEELEEVIRSWTEEEPEGMVLTDPLAFLDAPEREEAA